MAGFCTSSEVDVSKVRFAALSPTPNAGYIALRRNIGTVPSGLTDELETVAERGAICADATNASTCKLAYDALKPGVRVGYQVCFTRGDRAGCLETKAQAIAFLGSVKSIDEAFFVAEYEGYFGQCTYAEALSRGKQLADGSFRLAILHGDGCTDAFRAVIDVSPDGTIREIESKKVSIDFGGCP